MKNIISIILAAVFMASCTDGIVVSHQDKAAYTITTSPAEICDTQMNFSWATDTTITEAILEVTPVKDRNWKNSLKESFHGALCTTFDSV
ncbi:MAG: hypothetical protein J6S16_01055, partial [Bacteroidales bacterium]|nr:hypothetical protein [Bacteroidales bacterium]